MTRCAEHYDEQVIGPLLIILRVANRRALSKDVTVPEKITTIRFETPGRSMGDNETLTDVYSMSFMRASGETPSSGDIGNETTIEEVQASDGPKGPVLRHI